MREREVTFEHLAAYASGDLAGGEARRVEAYLGVLPEAARHADRLREVIEALRATEIEAPTPGAVRRALAAFARRVMAVLVFDSRRQPALAGFRGTASGHQLAFDCAAARIDVQILPGIEASPAWRLRGQVALQRDVELGAVSLAGADGPAVAWTSPDPFGRFRLESPPGVYDLLVELDQGRQTIVAPNVELGPEP